MTIGSFDLSILIFNELKNHIVITSLEYVFLSLYLFSSLFLFLVFYLLVNEQCEKIIYRYIYIVQRRNDLYIKTSETMKTFLLLFLSFLEFETFEFFDKKECVCA